MTEAIHFIDANVPMYAAGGEHPLKAPCVAILEAVARREMTAVTDAEVLQEMLHRYTAPQQRQRAAEVCRLFLKVVPDVLPVTREAIERALDLHLRIPHLQARDSLHAAVMLGHGVTRIISADRHFDGVPDLSRIDPAEFRGGA
ncbi:MAG: type II toxin-antitoxin system VapC family toxin [Armatimonadota bacterium]|nr:type II toxin-antitoxin system VapC family toxin [Armatimonadota bacterium]MDR7471002.1 type II toxin-antitoxin system VapC family toxin [Armatimonadota bacterium]